jgi:aconitate hydratase
MQVLSIALFAPGRTMIGADAEGSPVYLADIWPDAEEVQAAINENVSPEMFEEKYASVFECDVRWAALDAPSGDVYEWDDDSTYIREPPFFTDSPVKSGIADIEDARWLPTLGDTVTTDHISSAGPYGPDLPAGQWLLDHDVEPHEFNTYGARRGNHEVVTRGTFANVRIENEMPDDVVTESRESCLDTDTSPRRSVYVTRGRI